MAEPRISFVVIGYNEAAHLADCLQSVQEAARGFENAEILYVDGGSTDASMQLARDAGVAVLGGEKRRRAAENRNLGLHAAQGEYVQFVDGDMILYPDWPQAALRVMEGRPDAAAVCGRLIERRTSAFYQALQLDWRDPEGEVRYCGGAAMHRRAALLAAGGFPEDVAYGEEPLLCWRLRNDHGFKIYHLHEPMARHDLAYQGLIDYWRRNARVGETYAEISHRLKNTQEPFWKKETRSSLRWGFMLLLCGLLIVAAPWPVRAAALLCLVLLIARKTVQGVRWGQSLSVALLYALHTYGAKLGIAWGILRWRMRSGNS